MSGSESEDFFVEITFKKTGLTCGSGYCSGNDTENGIPVVEEIYTKTFDVHKEFVEDYINSDDDTLDPSRLKNFTTEKCECFGSQYCSKGIKVRREAIGGKLVSKKKTTLKKQLLEMRSRKAK